MSAVIAITTIAAVDGMFIMFGSPFSTAIADVQKGNSSMQCFAPSIPPPPAAADSDSSASNQGMGTLEHYLSRIPCLLQSKVVTKWDGFNWDFQNTNAPSDFRLVTDSQAGFKFKMFNLGNLYNIKLPFSPPQTMLYSSYCAAIRRGSGTSAMTVVNITRALEQGGSGPTITGGAATQNKIGAFVAIEAAPLQDTDVIALYRNCIEISSTARVPTAWFDQNGQCLIPGLFVNSYPPNYPASGLVFSSYKELVCVIKSSDITITALDESGASWKVIVDDFGTIRNASVGMMQFVH